MSMTEAEIFEGMGMTPPAEDQGESLATETTGQGDGLEGDGQQQDTATEDTTAAGPDLSDTDTQGPDAGTQEPDGEAEPAPSDQQPVGAAPATSPGGQPQLGSPLQPSGQGWPSADAVPAMDQPAPPEALGRKDPYTGQVIQTMAQFQAYQQAYQADVADLRRRQLSEQLQAAGFPADALEAMIQEAVAKDPSVLAAKELSDAARAQAQEAQFKEAMSWYDQQFKEINTLDPAAGIKDLHDLQQRDPAAFTRMMAAVGSGMTLVEAYRAIHYDRLAQTRSAAAEERVRVQAAGKSHLAPVGGGRTGGGEDVSVPTAVEQQFREFFPNMTEAEIQKEYARYLKESSAATR